LDRLVPLLEETISLNEQISSENRLTAQALHWGDQEQIENFSGNPPDLILVADCVYYEASVVPLVDTLEKLSSFSRYKPTHLMYEI